MHDSFKQNKFVWKFRSIKKPLRDYNAFRRLTVLIAWQRSAFVTVETQPLWRHGDSPTRARVTQKNSPHERIKNQRKILTFVFLDCDATALDFSSFSFFLALPPGPWSWSWSCPNCWPLRTICPGLIVW